MGDVPEEVMSLVRRREELRRAREYAGADAVRDELREAGFEVEDTPGGPAVRPLVRVAVHWLCEGWPEDVERGIESFRRHHDARGVRLVVVDVTGATWSGDIDVVRAAAEDGWGAARNAGLRAAPAPVAVIVDGSVEATGDVLTPLERELADPAVGVAGPFGVCSDDLREFREAPGPDVDAVEGYLMGFRREVLERSGLFDEGFRFYRAADLDLSFRIRSLGFDARVVPLPVRRHEHRAWSSTPEPERNRLSRRNFYRFLDRWGERTDLLVSPGPGRT